jgi:hypothetical protein
LARIRAELDTIERKISFPIKENPNPVPKSDPKPKTSENVVSPDDRRTKIRELRKVLRGFEKEEKRSNRLSKPTIPDKKPGT